MTSDYKVLLARKSLRGLPPSDALIAISRLVDGAYARRDIAGAQKATQWCKTLRSPKWCKRMSDQQKGEVLYLESVAWGDIEDLAKRGSPEEWNWAQVELTGQILCLRSALTSTLFDAQSAIRQCQILTNLANTLNRIGRSVEALQYWNRALVIDPVFGMALGNRAKGIYTYSSMLYDPNHQIIFLRRARDDVNAALSQDLDSGPRSDFMALKEHVDAILTESDTGREIHWDSCALGRSKRERAYRRWCLEHRLFLNPLNDIDQRPLAARDVLSMPSLTTSLRASPPSCLGLFNNLKQEFVSARYLCFEGMHHERCHFSDREVLLINTLDYPSYGLGIEQVKAAYRMSYSILDKVGYMLNEYMGFGIRAKDVSLRTMWFVDQDDSMGIVDFVQQKHNLPLRGLFWICRDLFEDRSGFKNSTEPDAQQLQQIRNHIEHRYLKVHETMWSRLGLKDEFEDTLATSIHREDLYAKSLRMLRFAREALICLVCAIQIEENARKAIAPGKLVVPMLVDRWVDEWKV